MKNILEKNYKIIYVFKFRIFMGIHNKYVLLWNKRICFICNKKLDKVKTKLD